MKPQRGARRSQAGQCSIHARLMALVKVHSRGYVQITTPRSTRHTGLGRVLGFPMNTTPQPPGVPERSALARYHVCGGLGKPTARCRCELG